MPSDADASRPHDHRLAGSAESSHLDDAAQSIRDGSESSIKRPLSSHREDAGTGPRPHLELDEAASRERKADENLMIARHIRAVLAG
jgi:hypothetical protein